MRTGERMQDMYETCFQVVTMCHGSDSGCSTMSFNDSQSHDAASIGVIDPLKVLLSFQSVSCSFSEKQHDHEAVHALLTHSP